MNDVERVMALADRYAKATELWSHSLVGSPDDNKATMTLQKAECRDALRAAVESLAAPAGDEWMRELERLGCELESQLMPDGWSNDDGDTWLESPDDAEFVDGLPLGQEFDLLASIYSYPVRYRIARLEGDETFSEPIDDEMRPNIRKALRAILAHVRQRVLPPVSAPEPDGEAKPVAWIEWNDAKNEASLGAEPTRDKETYELLPGFSFRPLYAASASQRELLRECMDAVDEAQGDPGRSAEYRRGYFDAFGEVTTALVKLREHLKDDRAGDAGAAPTDESTK